MYGSCIVYAIFYPKKFSNAFAALAISMQTDLNIMIVSAITMYAEFELELNNFERIFNLINSIKIEKNYNDLEMVEMEKTYIELEDACYSYGDT